MISSTPGFTQLALLLAATMSLLLLQTSCTAFTPSYPHAPLPSRHNINKVSTTTTTRRFLEPPLPNFCADCGNSEMVLQIPDGDERLRACCNQCGRIEYSNPKIVAACVVRTGDTACSTVLMAQRAIEPRKGTWGIPQGYMEHGETSREAAVREVKEETGVTLDPASLQFRAVYNVPGSVQLVYEALIEKEADISKMQEEIKKYNQQEGGESHEVALLSEEDLKEKEICFPTVSWALDHCRSRSPRIQQITKMFDPETQVWSQYEDEAVEEKVMNGL